ncbi:MAG: NAD(+) synthase [Bacteroidales bacterium]|jgi:NAD+ synthase (glutamine-hydrolysing)|nr:NAD(+) synthase [Bacteroidales bacterium]
MKIQIAQMNPKTLDFSENFKQINTIIRGTNADVLNVFAELSVSGSPLYDTAAYNEITTQASVMAEQLCGEKKSFIIGIPIKNGGEILNALLFVENGEVIDVATKKNLNSFDRVFAKGNGFEITQFEGETVAFGFEEDFDEFVAKGENVDVVICVANNIFEINRQKKTVEKFIPLVRRVKSRFIYVNRCGAEGSYIYNGGSFALNERGDICEQLPLFETCVKTIETSRLKLLTQNAMSKMETMYNAIIWGISDYFLKNRIKKAVIGLSGGIDSALVATLAVNALGKDNVIGVLMPSEYSTDHSVADAEDLANNLQIKHYIIPIKPLYNTTLQSLDAVFAGTPRGLAEENIQARLRCMVLMGIANKTGAALLNTSNKSEAAVGYGTLYGDTSGGIGAIGDVYKTDVWELAKWINRNGVIIPENSISKAPSAELSYGQKDSDSIPEYFILDKILNLYIEERQDKEQIISAGFSTETVEKVLHLIKINEWKRHQCCPCLKISSCTFGIDRLMPVS